MPYVIILSFCIFLQSLLHVQWLAYSHRARRAPSFTVSFLTVVVHVDVHFVCYCTKEPKMWTNVFVLLSFELVRYRTVCLYDSPPARCVPSSVCVLNLTSCLSPHCRFPQRCGWRCQSSGTWHRVSTSRYGVTSSVLPKKLFLLEQVLVRGCSVSLWFQHILHFWCSICFCVEWSLLLLRKCTVS